MSCKKDTRTGSLEKSLITNMLLASRTEPDASPDPNSVVGLPNLEAQGPPPANAGVVHRLLAAREFLGRVRTVERPSGISDRLSGGEPARGDCGGVPAFLAGAADGAEGSVARVCVGR